VGIKVEGTDVGEEKTKPRHSQLGVAAQQRWVNMEQRIRRVNVTGQDKQQFGR
jgi:hypothetical protein